jgi:hypothetical protein
MSWALALLTHSFVIFPGRKQGEAHPKPKGWSAALIGVTRPGYSLYAPASLPVWGSRGKRERDPPLNGSL